MSANLLMTKVLSTKNRQKNKHLFNHLSATVVLTCCAVALMLYWSSVRDFIFSSVSSITSFQPSTRSRYRSNDWLRSLMDMRWFCMSRVRRLLVAFRVVWVWETWSRTWRGTEIRDERSLVSQMWGFAAFLCFLSLWIKYLWVLVEQNKRTEDVTAPAPVPVSSSGCLQTPSSACWSPRCTESHPDSPNSWRWS